MTDPMDRRTFIRKGAGAGVGFGVLGGVPAVGGLPAPGIAAELGGYSRERTGVTVAVMGVNSRGNELAKAFARMGAEAKGGDADVI